jgi:hypothetical protein
MSFEGFYQVLCSNGHLDCQDVYEPSFSLSRWTCPVCNEEKSWWNLVDETNGSHEDGVRIDGFVELEVLEEAGELSNHHLGYRDNIYKIPKKNVERDSDES